MAKRILAATEVRQNLREVIKSLHDDPEPCYITQRSRPVAVLVKYDHYETVARKAQAMEELKSALRWSLGFIANLSAAMELNGDPAKYIDLLETSIQQGLRLGNVPRGVLSRLEDVEAAIKEWDHKTFRLQPDIQVLERTEESVVLGRAPCPFLLNVIRQHAPFHIKHINWKEYRGAAKEGVSDFLCLCCNLCCSGLVDWLSDGKFLVAEIPRVGGGQWKDTCAYAVRSKGG